MVKRFNITKDDFKAIGEPEPGQWLTFLRKFEIDKIFDGFAKEHFDKALELGCGGGEHSKHLAAYCKKLFAMEYNAGRLTERSNEKTTFVIGDAQNLSPFGHNEMDLIFSSNLIEHLPNLDACLAECKRVVKPDGLIIHTVPNRTWKLFHLLLYYLFGVKTLLRRLFSANKSVQISDSIGADTKLDSSLRPLNYSLRKNLLPKPHGISRSHFREFKNWGEKQWVSIFKRNGLEIVDIVRLPFYFGWGYDFRFILKLGNYLRLSSSTAFVLKKATKQ